MPIVQWDDSFEIGISQFDNHHKHLMALFNATYDMFIEDDKNVRIKEIVDELIDYETYHFAAEEDWMEKLNYPGQSEHKIQHDDFTTRSVEFQKELASGKATVTLEVLSFLQRWLIEHIKKCDGEYAEFIKKGPM